jgi:sulfotransferase family protein
VRTTKDEIPVTMEAPGTIMRGLPEPVFIIGSYRSGTSVLTWALGQHSNLFPLEETNWVYRLGVYLDCLYVFGTVNGQHSNLSSMGMSRTNFYKSFGRLINSFMLENRINYLKTGLKRHLRKNNLSFTILEKLTRVEDFAQLTDDDSLYAVVRSKDDAKSRWVDGTPENSHFVYCLNLMFPKAKFIFLIRNPIKVAHSLMNFATAGGSDYEEENAYNQWYGLTESCYHALKAYGSGKVLLIRQEDLISQKETVIEKCLSFIHEGYDINCLKPLEATINSSQFDRSKIDFSIENGLKSEKAYVQKACQFYNHILNDSPYGQKGSLHYYRILRNRYLDHAKRFYRGIN